MLTLKEEYGSKLIAELLSAYLEDRDASIEQICEKFGDVYIEQEDFEQSVLDFNDKTEKINDFIHTMYGETAFLKLADEKVVKIIEYIEAQLKFQIDGAFFLGKFDLDNNIKKKRKYLKKVISQYCQTGSLPNFGYEKDDRLGICRKSYERLKQNLSEYEEKIKKLYDENKNFFYDRPLIQSLIAYGKTLGFSSNVASDIILCLQKELESSRKISSILSSLSRTCIFLDKKIVFDGRHFLMDYINVYCKEQIQVLSITPTSIKKLDIFSDTILSDIAEMLDRFIKNSFNKIGDIEDKLGLERHEGIYLNIYEYINEKGDILIKAQEVFNKIDAEVDFEEEYRRIRKSSRNRWVGGGFGVGGAIKGAATAGLMNLSTGAIHSVINSVGNIKTSFKASKERQYIIRDILSDIPRETEKLLADVRPILTKDIKEKYSNYLWKPDTIKENELKKILRDSEEKSGPIAELLSQNPYDKSNYVEAFFILDEKHKLINSDPDLKTLFKISEWFHVDFKIALKTLLENDINYDLELKNEYFENIWNRILILCQPQEKIKYEELIYTTLINRFDYVDSNKYQENLRIVVAFIKSLQIVELREWLEKRIGEQIKKDIISISEKVETNSSINEGQLRKLVAEKKIASEEDCKKIEHIVDIYVIKIIEKYADEISIENPESTKAIKKRVLSLDTSLGVEKLKELLDEQIFNSLRSIKYGRDALKLETFISSISDETFNFENHKKNLQEYFHQLTKVNDYITDYTFGMKVKAAITKKNTGIEYADLAEADKVREQAMQIEQIYQDCDVTNGESIHSAISKLQNIYLEIGLGADVIKEMETRLEELDLRERTVLGIVYPTKEKAEEERRKVEEAEKEKRRQSKEKAEEERRKVEEAEKEKRRQRQEYVENVFEKEQIEKIESEISSDLERLQEIERRGLKTNIAKEKKEIYKKRIMEEYNQLQSDSTLKTTNIIKKKIKAVILCVVSIFTSLIGIGLFFEGGLIAKVFAVILVLWMWGCFLEAKEEVDTLKANSKKIVHIEKTMEFYK